jgi:hypothetical protein
MRALAFSFIFFAAACSLTPANPLDNVPSQKGNDPTQNEQGNQPPHASSGNVPQIPGSSGSSGTSSGEPEPQKDTRLFPVEVGRSWTYVTEQISQGQKTTSSLTQTITSKQTVDGKNAYVFTTSQQSGTYTSYVDVQGDDIFIRSANDNVWMQTAKAPVQEGATWTYSYHGTRKQTWHKAPKQTVDAGTFDDCWRLDYFITETSKPTDVNYSIMCRGVGTVLVELKLSNGFQSHQELASKSF